MIAEYRCQSLTRFFGATSGAGSLCPGVQFVDSTFSRYRQFPVTPLFPNARFIQRVEVIGSNPIVPTIFKHLQATDSGVGPFVSNDQICLAHANVLQGFVRPQANQGIGIENQL